MTVKYFSELAQYGLNETEVTIYVFLLQHGEFRVSDIANMNSLPRSSVYEALKHLSRLGLIEEILHGAYKKIRALPFTAIEHHLEERAAEVRNLTSATPAIEQRLSLLPDLRDEIPTQVRYYEGRAGARQLFWNTLKTTERVHVYSSWGRSQYVGTAFYERFVRESQERKINERVLVESSKTILQTIAQDIASPSRLSRTRAQDIRVMSDKNLTIAGEIFIYGDIYAQVTLKQGSISGFEIQNPHFSRMQKSVFATLWNQAKPFRPLR